MSKNQVLTIGTLVLFIALFSVLQFIGLGFTKLGAGLSLVASIVIVSSFVFVRRAKTTRGAYSRVSILIGIVVMVIVVAENMFPT